MPFGIETREESEAVITVANAIQVAIPAGTNGGVVMAAMAILIGVATRDQIPREHHDAVKGDLITLIDDLLEGRIQAQFAKDN